MGDGFVLILAKLGGDIGILYIFVAKYKNLA